MLAAVGTSNENIRLSPWVPHRRQRNSTQTAVSSIQQPPSGLVSVHSIHPVLSHFHPTLVWDTEK